MIKLISLNYWFDRQALISIQELTNSNYFVEINFTCRFGTDLSTRFSERYFYGVTLKLDNFI